MFVFFYCLFFFVNIIQYMYVYSKITICIYTHMSTNDQKQYITILLLYSTSRKSFVRFAVGVKLEATGVRHLDGQNDK